MSSTTARPLKTPEPFLIVRMVPTAILKYRAAGTAFSKPEDVIAINSQSLPEGVAVREEIESTGVRLPLVE